MFHYNLIVSMFGIQDWDIRQRKSFTNGTISGIIIKVICARSSVDRAPASGAGCVGSIPIGRIDGILCRNVCGGVFFYKFLKILCRTYGLFLSKYAIILC